MGPILVPAVFGLIGVALGGGLRMIETFFSRRSEARALLSAIVAEVEALIRLARHRAHYEAIVGMYNGAAQQIAAGHGNESCPTNIIHMHANFFLVFDESVGKVGLLKPYHADRITRFYVLAKALLENYHPESVLHGQPASFVAQAAINDLVLMRVVDELGRDIIGFRRVRPPKRPGSFGEGAPAALPPAESSPEYQVLVLNASPQTPTLS